MASKTGGGPPCALHTAQQEKVISLFSKTTSFFGITGTLESEQLSSLFACLFELMLYVQVNSKGHIGTLPPFYGTFTHH